MSTHVYLSSSSAVLADGLWQHLESLVTSGAPVDPLIGPVVFVPNRNADIWLRHRWALQHGIVMNIDLPYLEKGIRNSFDAGQGWSLIDKDSLRFAIMAEFLSLVQAPEKYAAEIMDWAKIDFVPHSPSEAGPMSETEACSPKKIFSESRLWDISGQLAEHYDNYMLHRHLDAAFGKMLEEHPLQGELLRRIRARLGASNPGGGSRLFMRDLLDDAVALNARRQAAIAKWGLHLFAFTPVSPLHLTVLDRLCRQAGADMHLWHLTPVDFSPDQKLEVKETDDTVVQLWTRASRSLLRLLSDIAGPLQVKRLPAELEQAPFRRLLELEAETAELGQSVANSLCDQVADGKAGALAVKSKQTKKPSSKDAERDALLANIWRDTPTGHFPDCLRVVGAPSILAEIEFVYNSILYNLAHDPSLQLEDIAILSADLTAYLPAIVAVFETGMGQEPGGRRSLSWFLAGQAPPLASSWAEGLLGLIALAENIGQGEFNRTPISKLLTNDCILEAVGASREDAAGWLTTITDLGIFRGAPVRPGAPLTTRPEHFSWAKGLARLRLARVMDADTSLWQGLIPAPRLVDQLDIFSALIEDLWQALQPLAVVRQDGAAWASTLRDLAERFLAVPIERRQQEGCIPKKVFAKLDDLQILPPCGISAIRAILPDCIEVPLVSMGQKGGVTVAGMQQLRPVPFRLVYITGCAEGVFPQAWRATNLHDLRTRDLSRWPGDIDDADRERMLFVETLLSVRDRLYISFINRDIIKDRPLYPSSLVSELLQVLAWQKDWPRLVSLPLTGWTDIPPQLWRDYPDVYTNYIRADRSVFLGGTVSGERALDDRGTEAVFAEGVLPLEAFSPLPTKSAREHLPSLHDIARYIKNPAAGLAYFKMYLKDMASSDSRLETDEPFILSETGIMDWDVLQPLILRWLLDERLLEPEAWMADSGWHWYQKKYALVDKVPADFLGCLAWDELLAKTLTKMYLLLDVRKEVQEAKQAGRLHAPLVFGKPPRSLLAEPVGQLLPALDWAEGIRISGELPLVWVSDSAIGPSLYIFITRDCKNKTMQAVDCISSLRELFLALPLVQKLLGFENIATTQLVFQNGVRTDLVTTDGVQQEQAFDLALRALLVDDGPLELIPAKEVIGLVNSKMELNMDNLLKRIQADDDNKRTRPVLSPALRLLAPEVPDDKRIASWYETILRPWLALTGTEQGGQDGA